MVPKRKHIRVFEHQSLRVGETFLYASGSAGAGDERHFEFNQAHLDALVAFFEKEPTYFSLIRNGVKFNEYVGALQVGDLVISVLPKADKAKDTDKDEWQRMLLGMIRAVHGFDVKAPSSASLNLKNNSVLDLYFEMFLAELAYLQRRGLVKQYRKTEGNQKALKGSLQFSKQITQNLIHKERFYTRYTTYDTQHVLHQILYEALGVLQRINTNANLIGPINSSLLNFPEMPAIHASDAVFDKLVFNRKTAAYPKAIYIARLLLLHYHPNLSKGRKDVLALMFDMNNLWEQFILASLRKEPGWKVRGKASALFWLATNGKKQRIEPDILIEDGQNQFIIDTKWKLVEDKADVHDVRQMYAYHRYFKANRVALLYPGAQNEVKGTFQPIPGASPAESDLGQCGLLFIPTRHAGILNWQVAIREQIRTWIEAN